MEQLFQIFYFVDWFICLNLAVVEDDDTVTHLTDLLHDMR